MLEIISKLYTITLVLLPALNVYRSPIPSVELGTLIILFCTVFFFCSKPGIYKPGLGSLWIYLLLVFFVCTAISSIILDYDSAEYSKVYFRFFKIVIIVISIFIIGKDRFNYELAIKALKIFSLLCAFYIIVQNIGYYLFGIRILGVYSPLASVEEYVEFGANATQDVLYRPSAFFFEPAHFASYSMVYLCRLFTHDGEKYRIWQIVIMITGLLLSTSGTALSIIPVIFLLSIAFKIREGTIAFHNAWKYILLFLVVAVLIRIFLTSYIGSSALGRFFNDDGTLGGAFTGRLQSGAYELFKELPSVLQFIGCGFGNRPADVYFPSMYAILYGDGYLGLALFVLLLIIYFVKARNFGKMLCLTYGLLFIGTGAFNFASIGLYFCLIAEETRKREYDNFYQ